MARSGSRRDLFIQVGGNVDPLKTAMKAGKSVLAEFGTAAIDVQEEVRKALSKLGDGAPVQAKQLEQAYARTFEAIKANAKAALSAPDGASAVDVLNAGAARQAAEAAEAKAASLRIVADAAARSAAATNGDSDANRLFAITAEAAAQGAREEAAALRVQANVLGSVEGQIEGVTSAKRRQIAVSGQARAGMQQLSYQLNDVAVQFAAGTPPMIIFAQQSGQVVQALGLMTTKTSGLLGFLGGPWGIGLSSAAVVLTPFVAKLFEEADAAEKAAQELEENRAKTKATEEAKASFARTAPGVIDAIKSETEELEKQNRSLQDNIRLRQGKLRGQIDDARGAGAQTARDLTDARKELADREATFRRAQSPQGQLAAGEAAGIALAQAQSAVAAQRKKVAALEQQLKDIVEQIDAAQRGIRVAGIPLAEQQAREAVDSIAAINGEYDRQAEAAKKAAAGNDQLAASLAKTLTGIERLRAKDLDKERQRQSQSKKTPDADLTDFVSPVSGGRVTGRFGEKRENRGHAGLDIAVPVGTNVVAPAAGVVIEAGTLPGFGNVVYIDHGRGTVTRLAHLSKIGVAKGDLVGQGDLVGLSGGAKGAPGSGNSQGPHLHQEVRVNGRAVNPAKGRFATDHAAVALKAAQVGSARGRSADAEERRELLEDIRFGDEERKLRLRLLDLEGRRSNNLEKRVELELEEIEVERKAYADKVDKLEQAKKLDAAEAARLKGLSEEVAEQRKRNLKIEEATRTFNRQAEAQSRSLDHDIQILRLQLDLATTMAERKRVAAELLAAEQKQRRLALEAVRDNPGSSAEQVQQAKDDLGRLPEVEAGERTRDAERFRSPMEEYRARLEERIGDINQELEKIEVRAIERLEDEFVGAAAKALGLKGAIGEVVAELIRLGLQAAILAAMGGEAGPGGGGGGFLNLLGGMLSGKRPAGSGAGGSALWGGPDGTWPGQHVPPSFGLKLPRGSGVLGFLASIFGGGRAAGGPIDPSKWYMVGEEGPELFAPGLSGTIIPNHVITSASMPKVPSGMTRGGDNISVHAPITLNAPGADPSQLARLQAQFEQAQREIPGRAVAAVREAIGRRAL